MADVTDLTPDNDQPQAVEPVATLDTAPAAPEPAREVEPTSASAAEPAGIAAAAPMEPTPAAAPAPVAEAEPVAEPEPEPTPEPLPQPQAAAAATEPIADRPSLASTIEVPATAPADADAGEGGEWALLQAKVSQWLSSGELQRQWQASRRPLSLLAALIALLLVLRIYSALLNVIDGIPLLPGLLELAGVIAAARFSLTRLVRSEERQQLLQGLRQRWASFRGKG